MAPPKQKATASYELIETEGISLGGGVPAPHRQGLPAWLPDSEGTTAPPHRLLAGAPSRRPGRQRPDLPPGAGGGGTGR